MLTSIIPRSLRYLITMFSVVPDSSLVRDLYDFKTCARAFETAERFRCPGTIGSCLSLLPLTPPFLTMKIYFIRICSKETFLTKAKEKEKREIRSANRERSEYPAP